MPDLYTYQPVTEGFIEKRQAAERIGLQRENLDEIRKTNQINSLMKLIPITTDKGRKREIINEVGSLSGFTFRTDVEEKDVLKAYKAYQDFEKRAGDLPEEDAEQEYFNLIAPLINDESQENLLNILNTKEAERTRIFHSNNVGKILGDIRSQRPGALRQGAPNTPEELQALTQAREEAIKSGDDKLLKLVDDSIGGQLGISTQKGVADIVTWITPGGQTVNLKKGVFPPEGSTRAPTRSIRESVGDVLDDAMIDLVGAFVEANGRQPTHTEKAALRVEAARTVKRQSPTEAGEVTAAKEEQKHLAKAFNIAVDEGIPAQGNKWRIQQARKLIDKGKVFTGKLEPIRKWLSEYYSAITGKTSEGLPETQLLTAIANRSALLLVGASQGKEGGMPANLFSEADREFVVASTFNPTQTPEAIKRLMEISEKAEDYRIIKSKVFQKYKKDHDNKLDLGVYGEITKEMEKLYPTINNVNVGGQETSSGNRFTIEEIP